MAALQGVDKQHAVAPRVILVVEDDPDISFVLRSTLEEEGSYQVMLASNGFQAFDLIRRVRPDLFLFDYKLPGINGLELYQRLHASREFVTIPMLLMSAYVPREAVENLHLPYLRKPFELEELLQKVDMLLTG